MDPANAAEGKGVGGGGETEFSIGTLTTLCPLLDRHL